MRVPVIAFAIEVALGATTSAAIAKMPGPLSPESPAASKMSLADTPCDFNGLSVGDKLTPAAAMAVLGVKQFKLNWDAAPSKEFSKNLEKFGIADASAIEDWKVGPHCNDENCAIPYGITFGNQSDPVSVFVAFRDLVTEIDISFNAIHWDALLPVIFNKYGDNWKKEYTKDTITDLTTQKTELVDRVLLTNRNDGTNRKTGDKCQIWATNYDSYSLHHDPAGPQHSQFVIKLVSKNF